MSIKFKPQSIEDVARFQRADDVAKKLGGAIAKLSDQNDQLIARVLFNCPFWHKDPTMITYPGHAAVIEVLGERGFITVRQHFADEYPLGLTAFEITEDGLDFLEAMVGPDLADDALKERTWYRENSSYDGWMARVRQKSFERLMTGPKQ